MFSALTFAVPHHIKPVSPFLVPAWGPRVTASIQSFDPVPPAHAYDSLIWEAAARYRLDPALVRSVIRMESAFNPLAVSRAGAMGLMQLMPDIAEAFGVTDPFDPRENIMAGAHLLRDLLDLHHGNLPLTLASYNAGAGVVAKYGHRIPPFKETQNYVKRIAGFIADEHAGSD